MSDAIARLRIMLDDVEPKVLRRIDVPLGIRLDRLHLTLQAALGWTNSHLLEFRARNVGWGIPDPTWPEGPLDARKVTLAAVLEDTGVKTLRYLYDFGDGWEHAITVERIGDPQPNVLYPCLIEAKGCCPPEDIGGPWGYGELLDALADPKHERHDEARDLLGETFDPNAHPSDALAQNVAALATRWIKKPATRKSRSH